MKRKNKLVSRPWFFIAAIIIILFTVASFFGIDNYHGDIRTLYVKGAGDIRWVLTSAVVLRLFFLPN